MNTTVQPLANSFRNTVVPKNMDVDQMNIGVNLEIREVRSEELGQAALVAARGMRDNPMHIAAFGRDDAKREQKIGALFGTVLPMLSGKAIFIGSYRSGELVGIAGIIRPQNCRLPATESLRMLPRLLPRLGLDSLIKMGRWQGVWRQHDPVEPHWHLGPVAVDMHLQGQGIGSTLLEAVCARMDSEGSLLYLETDKPENVRFYQKFGFETLGQTPVIGVTNWFMQRVARA